MFVGNLRQYGELLAWLRDSKAHMCMICGPTGCGKTYGILQAAKECNKVVSVYDTSICLNGKDFKEQIMKTTKSNIMAQLLSTSSSERLIFLDELDAMLAIDRTFLTHLQTLATNIKIVIASAIDVSTKLPDGCKILHLNAPSEQDIVLLLKDVHKSNPVGRRLTMLEAAESCNGNISVALRYMITASNKNTNYSDTFDTIAMVYRAPHLAYKVFTMDPWLNPMRYHENFLHEMKQRIKPRNSLLKEDVYTEFLLDICYWDMLMGDTSSHHDFAILYIAKATQKLDKLALKKTAMPPKMEFTRLINLMSVRKKNVVNMHACKFPWHQVGVCEKTFLKGK